LKVEGGFCGRCKWGTVRGGLPARAVVQGDSLMKGGVFSPGGKGKFNQAEGLLGSLIVLDKFMMGGRETGIRVGWGPMENGCYHRLNLSKLDCLLSVGLVVTVNCVLVEEKKRKKNNYSYRGRIEYQRPNKLRGLHDQSTIK